jgi:peptidoglycan-associated lipoprotein
VFMTATIQISKFARASVAIVVLSMGMLVTAAPVADAADGINLFPRSLSRQFNDDVQNAVFFSYDSASLTNGARRVLRAQAAWIIGHEGVRLRVTGYTDNLGNADYNATLGNRRAMAVAAYLTGQGVESDLIKIKVRVDRNPIELAGVSAMNSSRRAETKIINIAMPDVGSDTLIGTIISWVPLAPGDPIETVDGTTSIGSTGGGDTGSGDTGGDPPPDSGSDTGSDPIDTGTPTASDPIAPGNSGDNRNDGGNDNAGGNGKGRGQPTSSPTF